MTIEPVPVSGVAIGGDKPVLIMGPCVIESESHTLDLAITVQRASQRAGLPVIFKASFDKANRTSHSSYRGPGLEEGLRILQEVRTRTGLPVTTDVHEPHQVDTVAAAVDLLQIPAFLCRQTDLVVACARSGRPTSIKKGQFLAGDDCAAILDKYHNAGGRNAILIERGNSFGYHCLVADLRNLPMMRALGVPVLFDGTHSVQAPGGLGHASGGQGYLAPVLMRAAIAAGCEGLFLEVHDAPERALSDGANVVSTDRLDDLLDQIAAIHQAIGRPPPPSPR